MAPAKKKAAPNGFYFYMLEVREDIEGRTGKRPTMVELQHLAGPGWSALSPEDKEPYNEKAKEHKLKLKLSAEKYNSLGVPFSALVADARKKQEEEDIMKATIQNIVTEPKLESLRTVRFYVAHVNWYYQLFIGQEYWHCPCEISIVEFTLLDGITGKFHKILDSGDVPLGVRADAKEQAEKHHGIHLHNKPGKPVPLKESNMQLVFQAVIEFLRRGVTQEKQGKEILPPIFTMPNSVGHNHSLTAVKNALQTFSEASHERRDLFRVYPLPQLFFELKLRCDNAFSRDYGLAILQSELENDVFGGGDSECQYHQESENGSYCSQAVAMNWAFTVMDHICIKVGVKTIPGQHAPEGFIPVSSSKVSNWSTEEIATTATASVPSGFENLKLSDIQITSMQKLKDQLKEAENCSLPSSRNWKDGPSAKDRYVAGAVASGSVPSAQNMDFPVRIGSPGAYHRGLPRLASGSEAAGSIPSAQNMDFPAWSGFPDLSTASGGAYRQGSPENTRDALIPTPVFGRGRMFERAKKQ